MVFIKRKSKEKDSIQKIQQEQSERTVPIYEEAYLAYQSICMIDVTFFDAKTPADPFGYVCEGLVELFSDGEIKINSLDKNKTLEDFNVRDLFLASNNINGHDPKYRRNVKFVTRKKEIGLIFKDIKTKGEFWEAFSSVRCSLAARVEET